MDHQPTEPAKRNPNFLVYGLGLVISCELISKFIDQLGYWFGDQLVFVFFQFILTKLYQFLPNHYKI